MNIFALDEDPVIAAEMHCDRHVLKMIIEHTQMLTYAYYHTIGIFNRKLLIENQEIIHILFDGFPRVDQFGNPKPYGISHYNHPCTKWARECKSNWKWLLDCTISLCNEYEKRWGKVHSVKKLLDWMQIRIPFLKDSNKITPFAQVVPECFISDDPILSYRKYYAIKNSIMQVKWNYSDSPYWWDDEFIKSANKEYEIYKKIKGNNEITYTN